MDHTFTCLRTSRWALFCYSSCEASALPGFTTAWTYPVCTALPLAPVMVRRSSSMLPLRSIYLAIWRGYQLRPTHRLHLCLRVGGSRANFRNEASIGDADSSIGPYANDPIFYLLQQLHEGVRLACSFGMVESVLLKPKLNILHQQDRTRVDTGAQRRNGSASEHKSVDNSLIVRTWF